MAPPAGEKRRAPFLGRLFLQIIAGFLVISLASSVTRFVGFLKLPSSVDLIPVPDGSFHEWLAIVVFIGYLANVFRQVQSFGIMAEDDRFTEEVTSSQSRKAQVGCYLCLVVVLVLPCLLLAALGDRLSNGSEAWSARVLPFLQQARNGDGYSALCPAWIVLATYIATALVFLIWDILTQA